MPADQLWHTGSLHPLDLPGKYKLFYSACTESLGAASAAWYVEGYLTRCRWKLGPKLQMVFGKRMQHYFQFGIILLSSENIWNTFERLDGSKTFNYPSPSPSHGWEPLMFSLPLTGMRGVAAVRCEDCSCLSRWKSAQAALWEAPPHKSRAKRSQNKSSVFGGAPGLGHGAGSTTGVCCPWVGCPQGWESHLGTEPPVCFMPAVRRFCFCVMEKQDGKGILPTGQTQRSD